MLLAGGSGFRQHQGWQQSQFFLFSSYLLFISHMTFRDEPADPELGNALGFSVLRLLGHPMHTLPDTLDYCQYLGTIRINTDTIQYNHNPYPIQILNLYTGTLTHLHTFTHSIALIYKTSPCPSPCNSKIYPVLCCTSNFTLCHMSLYCNLSINVNRRYLYYNCYNQTPVRRACLGVVLPPRFSISSLSRLYLLAVYMDSTSDYRTTQAQGLFTRIIYAGCICI